MKRALSLPRSLPRRSARAARAGTGDVSARLVLSVFATALLSWFVGCDTGGDSAPGVGITNVSQAAPVLPERNPENNEYDPYFATGELNRPRYFHESIPGRSGLTFVFGGSDERGLSTLDTVEFFDQARVDQDRPTPESETGIWLDTNFEGDPIAFNEGPRMFFTIDMLADGRIIMMGGTTDIEAAQRAYAKSEIYDPDTRSFETLETEMITPRFRHKTVRLFNGNFLVIGGQEVSTVTIINENIEPGQPGRQEQRTVFLSTPKLEIFSVTSSEYENYTLPNSSRQVTLNTPRGRAGHDVQRIAGFDGRLGSADDLFIIAGGFQTLSGSSAPQTKQYGAVGREEADALTVVEFLDSITNVVTQAGNISLGEPRIDTPHIINLGLFNDFTIDGVEGMGNAVLITHGNTDDFCPRTDLNANDELFVATFTGFGPAQGLQFFNVEDLQTLSQMQGVEAPPGSLPGVIPLGTFGVGRCQTNPVPLPRRMVTAADVPDVETWVITAGGTHIFPAPGCIYFSGEPISVGCVFDPFYNLRAATLLGRSTRDLRVDRTSSNPLGIVGTWLTLDGEIPTVDLNFFGTTQASRMAHMTASWRVYAFNIAIPGTDGIINTVDDRVLLSGGGTDGRFAGAEPAAPSAEILLPPNVNSTTPSP